jgi:virginiamycin B lyase
MVGPDGALWFTELGGQKIGRITTGGAATDFAVPTTPSSPLGIVTGPDGALWFTETQGNKIGRAALSAAPGTPIPGTLILAACGIVLLVWFYRRRLAAR